MFPFVTYNKSNVCDVSLNRLCSLCAAFDRLDCFLSFKKNNNVHSCILLVIWRWDGNRMSNPSEFSCPTFCVIAKLWCLIAVICLYSVQLQWRKRQRGEFSSRLALLAVLVFYSHQSLCRHLAWTCVTGSPCQLPGSWWIFHIPCMVLRRSCEMLMVFMWVGMSMHWDTGIN